MMGFQAEGAAPIVRGSPVAEPRTIASAIRVGNPASWRGAEHARDASGGTIEAVTDEEIMAAVKLMSRSEGIFCEPASGAAVAGLLKLSRLGLHLNNKTVVCVITGTGLKDTAAVGDMMEAEVEEYPAEPGVLEKALALV
jgi:threonine synthase